MVAGCGNGGGARPADELTVLLPRDVIELDPRFVSDAYGLKVTRLLFGSLMRIDPLTLETVPDLAERVELQSPTRYDVTLRPSLRFSDGSALDSADVVATFRGLQDPKLQARYAPSYARIVKVEALDARRVRFELNGPHATFLTDLEIPIVRAEDAFRRMPNGPGKQPIGAGPYVLTQREPGRLALRANDHWYAGRAKHEYVRMLVVRDDNTRALRMLAGAADLALNAVPPGLVPLFTREAGFDVAAASGINTTYIGINTQAPSLRDARVRQALAFAIDRKALIEAKLGGRAELASSFIPSGHWAFASDTPSYAFDPPRARALLEEAGLPQPEDGPRLHLALRCGSDRFRISIARAIVAMLADVGVEVDVLPMETATMLADLDRGQFELTLLQMPEVIEPHVLYWWFGQDRIPGPGREGANRWRYGDAALEAALERGRSHIDREVRTAAYRDVQHLLAEALPVIPLWHEDVVAVRAQAARDVVVPRDGRFTTLAR
ncbi:MAG TPA: ABC transporter substrate-binding protein [Polyangiales bacterium]|nr:ABC transporter substrate-binding protein [Polyangiales bacterium]